MKEPHGPRLPADGLRLEPSDDPDQVVLSWPIGAKVPHEMFTAAEVDVLLALLRGDSDDAIAAARGSSARTVAVQVQRIYLKLGVSGRRAVLALFG